MDHNHQTGTGLSICSVLMFILAHIGIGDIASWIAVTSGVASLFINWPKIKKRLQDIKNKKNGVS